MAPKLVNSNHSTTMTLNRTRGCVTRVPWLNNYTRIQRDTELSRRLSRVWQFYTALWHTSEMTALEVCVSLPLLFGLLPSIFNSPLLPHHHHYVSVWDVHFSFVKTIGKNLLVFENENEIILQTSAQRHCSSGDTHICLLLPLAF